MSAIQNHKALWRKKRQCCDAKDVKRKPKTASHVKITWQNVENNLSVVTNLSSKKLVNNEINLLNKGLGFGILPGKFTFL